MRPSRGVGQADSFPTASSWGRLLLLDTEEDPDLSHKVLDIIINGRLQDEDVSIKRKCCYTINPEIVWNVDYRILDVVGKTAVLNIRLEKTGGEQPESAV